MNHQYYMPTRIIMGDDCVLNHAGIFREMGKKALIVTGKNSAKANGSLCDVISVLDSNAQQYAIYDRVMSNPTIDCVYEGADFSKAEQADFIIAIGGGSPMDAAKVIALLARQNIARDNLFLGKYDHDVLPMIFVPTTAGTGSEVTPYSILTNDQKQTKTSVASPFLFPKAAFLDGKYTQDLPKNITIHTAIDALSHAVEGMLSVRANPITDGIAVESIRMIASCVDALKTGMLTKEQRFHLLYASTLGGMVIANTGTTAVHAMGYSLTYHYDVDHGRANGLLLAAFLSFVRAKHPERVDFILSQMGVRSVEHLQFVLNSLLGERETLTTDEMEAYAAKAAATKNITNCISVAEKADLLKVYQASLTIK